MIHTVKELKELLASENDNANVKDVIVSLVNTYLDYQTVSDISIAATTRLTNENAHNLHSNTLLRDQLLMTKMYLNGEMYTDAKYAKDMLPLQIQNIDICISKVNNK